MKTRAWVRAAAAVWAALSAWASLRAYYGGGFRFNGLLSRVITPNSGGLNDKAIFCVDNPADSEVDAKIFSVDGALVANLGPAMPAAATSCSKDSSVPSGPQYLTWDGRANGETVRGGIYVFQIKSEGLAFTGILLVVR